MSSVPIFVTGCGLVSAVGFDAAASAAAVRAKVPHIIETAFFVAGEPLFAAQMPLPEGLRGYAKARLLLSNAAAEAVQDSALTLGSQPLLVFIAVADEQRPGALVPDDVTLLKDLAADLGVLIDPGSQILRMGRWAGAEAIIRAKAALQSGHPSALVVAYDSLLTGPTINDLAAKGRLITKDNPDGFIPGEAASAVVLTTTAVAPSLRLVGLGVGNETVGRDSEKRLRGDGLAGAFRAAVAESAIPLHQIGWRIAGIRGDQYDFTEATAALGRTLRVVRPRFEAWTPTDCLGEIGAATMPALITIARHAFRRGYALGHSVVIHLGGDGPERCALILTAQETT
jgi:3-oxoacyl-[acyl-carrier-protein] synthase I